MSDDREPQPIPLAAPEGDPILGRLRWRIHEVETHRTLDEGEKLLQARHFALRWHTPTPRLGKRNSSWFDKRLTLTKPFLLGISEHPSPNVAEYKGVGLSVDRTDLHTFCWEWFLVDEARATKLQESGVLGIVLRQGEKGWEIAQTTFETDVSFRVMEFGRDIKAGPQWRVTIRQGSVVRWPLGNGSWPDLGELPIAECTS